MNSAGQLAHHVMWTRDCRCPWLTRTWSKDTTWQWSKKWQCSAHEMTWHQSAEAAAAHWPKHTQACWQALITTPGSHWPTNGCGLLACPCSGSWPAAKLQMALGCFLTLAVQCLEFHPHELWVSICEPFISLWIVIHDSWNQLARESHPVNATFKKRPWIFSEMMTCELWNGWCMVQKLQISWVMSSFQTHHLMRNALWVSETKLMNTTHDSRVSKFWELQRQHLNVHHPLAEWTSHRCANTQRWSHSQHTRFSQQASLISKSWTLNFWRWKFAVTVPQLLRPDILKTVNFSQHLPSSCSRRMEHTTTCCSSGLWLVMVPAQSGCGQTCHVVMSDSDVTHKNVCAKRHRSWNPMPLRCWMWAFRWNPMVTLFNSYLFCLRWLLVSSLSTVLLLRYRISYSTQRDAKTQSS